MEKICVLGERVAGRPGRLGRAASARLAIAFAFVAALAGSLGFAGPASAAGWQVQPVPEPNVPAAALSSVACPSAAGCFAVGSSIDSYGVSVTLAETSNGTSWAPQPTPNPSGATSSKLSGIACSSASDCIAVGSFSTGGSATDTLAEVWNGSTWTVQATPDPSGASSSQLSGIACRSALDCIAVGSFSTASATDTLSEAWNGSTWTVQSTSDPTGASDSTLSGIACPSANECIAVGASDGDTLAEAWNGASWTLQTTQNYSDGSNSTLTGVACWSGAACMAVGSYDVDVIEGGEPLAEEWNGSAWTALYMPNPGQDDYLTIDSVSCGSSGACTAVGGEELETRPATPVIERFDGTSWSAEDVSYSAQLGLMVGGVLCTTAGTACTAVGDTAGLTGQLASGEGAAWAGTWNGSGWSEQSITSPPGTIGSYPLPGVSCVTASWCMAVGQYENSTDAWQTLAELWTGSSWAVSPTPSPAESYGAGLGSVSCFSETNCTAVGSYQSTSRQDLAIAEHWDGTSWTTESTPTAGLTDPGLGSVSCPSATFCLAVGSSYLTEARSQPLVEAWNGSVWTVVSSPTSNGGLTSVSCISPDSCMAVGSNSSAGPYAALWNGASWTAETPPAPAGSAGAFLDSVSCTGASSCTAVGVAGSGNQEYTLAEDWDGNAWSIETTPDVAGTSNVLDGVSCATASSCTTVGYSNSGSYGQSVALAEQWNGNSWTITPTPGIAGSSQSSLTGVSCASATTCSAVGSVELSADVALAEQYSTPSSTPPTGTGSGTPTGGNPSRGGGSSSGGGGSPSAVSAPVNTSLPVISGSATVGQSLRATTGSWTGTAPLRYTYQWQLCTSTCRRIAGAAGSRLKLTSRDRGHRVRVVVSASNAAKLVEATSPRSPTIAPSDAELRSSLLAQLESFDSTRLARTLLARGWFGRKVTALEDGSIRVLVRAATGPRTVVATGGIYFSKPGRATFWLGLSPAGRTLLLDDQPLKVTSTAIFLHPGLRLTAHRTFLLPG